MVDGRSASDERGGVRETEASRPLGALRVEGRRGATALLLLAVVAAAACSEPRRPNFVVFLVDTLRPDHLGVYGYGKNTSPNLDDRNSR